VLEGKYNEMYVLIFMKNFRVRSLLSACELTFSKKGCCLVVEKSNTVRFRFAPTELFENPIKNPLQRPKIGNFEHESLGF
jgi:hypothetical protein